MSNIYVKSLEVKDIGGIEKFSCDLGHVSVISGANGLGKTSLLSALNNIFEGGHDCDLRRNVDLDGDGILETPCESGEIRITLSDGTTITKTITAKESKLLVKSADGGKIGAAKTFLESLTPPKSFNPIDFLNADAKDRAAFLLKTLPLNFTDKEVNEALGIPKTVGPVTLEKLNQLYDGIYDERKDLNVTVRDMEGVIASMEKSLPSQEGKDWGAERDRIQKEISEVESNIKTVAAEIALEAEKALNEKRVEIDKKIADLKAELSAFVQTVEQTAAATLAEETRDMQAHKVHLSEELGAAKANADREQQAAGVRQAINDQRKALEGHVAKELRLTKSLKALLDLKHKKLKELPIEGLDLKSDSKGRPVIMIGGVPLDKLNRQQALFVAIQAVQLAAGRLPLILLEAAEIDDAHLAELAGAIKDAGLQLVVARWKNNAPLQVETAA